MNDSEMRAWAEFEGLAFPDRAWLLHPFDVWVANPHYKGPAEPHPEQGPPPGSWADVARMMAGAYPDFDWDAWKDEQKEAEL